MPEAEIYLDKVCACIRDKRTRSELREELRGHLDELAAGFMADGLSEEEAYRKAAAAMGNANAVGEQLGRIHSFFPLRRCNTALTLLFWGFLLSSFVFDFNGWYVDEIAQTLGSFLMLASVFMLRRSNIQLTAAFALLLINFIVTVAGNILHVLPAFYGSAGIGWALLIIGIILYAFFMFALGYGIAAFSAGKRARQMKQCGFLHMGNLLCSLMMYLLPDVFVLWAIVFVLLKIVILHHLCCVRTDIWRNEREVPMLKMGKLAAAALAMLMILTVAAPTATAAALTNRPVTAISYDRTDVGTDAATQARLRSLEARIKAETGHDLVVGDSDRINSFRDIFDSTFADVRQSDLLEFENALSFSTFGYDTNSGLTCLILTAVTSENRAKMLFYYRIKDFLPLRGARQIAFAVSSTKAAALPDTRRFITLSDTNEATVEIVPEYEFKSAGPDTDGVELRCSRDMYDQRGYITQEFYYGGDEARVMCNIEIYDQLSFYRAPYDYDNLEINAFCGNYDANVWYRRNTSVAVSIGGRSVTEII